MERQTELKSSFFPWQLQHDKLKSGLCVYCPMNTPPFKLLYTNLPLSLLSPPAGLQFQSLLSLAGVQCCSYYLSEVKFVSHQSSLWFVGRLNSEECLSPLLLRHSPSAAASLCHRSLHEKDPEDFTSSMNYCNGIVTLCYLWNVGQYSLWKALLEKDGYMEKGRPTCLTKSRPINSNTGRVARTSKQQNHMISQTCCFCKDCHIRL